MRWGRPIPHSLCLLALVVGAPPRVPPRLPLGHGQVRQEGRQRALDLVRLPTQGMFCGAVVGALAVEADVVGWWWTDTPVSGERHIPCPSSLHVRLGQPASTPSVRPPHTRSHRLLPPCGIENGGPERGADLPKATQLWELRPASTEILESMFRGLKKHKEGAGTPQRERMSANHRSDKDLAFGTCGEQLKNKKVNNPTDKWAEGFNRSFSKEKTQMAKDVKTLVVRGMHWNCSETPLLMHQAGFDREHSRLQVLLRVWRDWDPGQSWWAANRGSRHGNLFGGFSKT